MPVLIVGTEKNFAALRPRLFSGRVPAAAAREIAEAVRKANPGVDVDALEPGTVLTIPDLPHVEVDGDLSLDDTVRERIAELSATAADTLEQIVGTARRLEDEGADERSHLAESLDREEIAVAAREEPALSTEVDAIRGAIDEEGSASK